MLLVATLAICIAGQTAAFPQSIEPPPAQSAAAGVLTLSDALARVAGRSALVEAAQIRERSFVEARRAVPRLPNPSVELRGENYSSVPSSVLARDLFATVVQPIELGGKHAARVAEAEAAEKAAATDAGVAQWTISTAVAELYLSALRSREIAAILTAQRDSVTEIVNILVARVREGVGVEADLRRFETERTRLVSQIGRAALASREAVVKLKAVIGEPVTIDSLAAPALPAVPEAPPELEASIARRADVRRAAAQLEQAQARLAFERSLGFPDLMMTGGYKRTDGHHSAVAGVGLSVPLFNRNRTAIAQAEGEVNAATLELEQTRREARADVEARWAAAHELAARAARAEADMVAPAGVVRTAARTAFVEGRGDILQLVDAERVFAEASREALELRLDAVLAAIYAQLAVGNPPILN